MPRALLQYLQENAGTVQYFRLRCKRFRLHPLQFSLRWSLHH